MHWTEEKTSYSCKMIFVIKFKTSKKIYFLSVSSEMKGKYAYFKKMHLFLNYFLHVGFYDIGIIYFWWVCCPWLIKARDSVSSQTICKEFGLNKQM